MSNILVATSSAPSTPASNQPNTIVSNAPTGNWQHPHFDEIYRRLNESRFGERHIKSLAWNTAILLLTFLDFRLSSWQSVFPLFHSYWANEWHSPSLDSFIQFTGTYVYYGTVVVRLVLLWNITVALSPIFRVPDDLSDIPLTPSQRALLGLGPASRPASPASPYITPPKYSRSPTPLSSRGSRSLSGSALSDSVMGGSIRGTPNSPSASPLFHKAIGKDAARRLSYGTPSPLGLSSRLGDSSASSLMINTPSPPAARGASVGLSSRWLYERGRASPR